MKSIRSKLWSAMMAMMSIIIVLLWLFQIVFLDKFYSVFEIGEVKNRAEGITADLGNLDSLSHINSSQLLIEEVESFVYEKQLTAEIIDTNYRVVYSDSSGNSMTMPGMMNNSYSDAALRALNGEENTQEIIHPKFGYKFMIIGLPIINGNSIEGAMIITMPMASIEETSGIIMKQLVIITLILFLISIFLSSKLSRNFAEPISEISRQAESFSMKNFDVRIKNTSDDEIGRLAKRMNEMGEALTRNDILQKELIANVSHELRTPLTLIRGYAETLKDVTGNNPEKREKQLGIIIDESDRLGRIVEDILKLSQIQAGAVRLEIESFSLNELLHEIKESFEMDMKGRTLELVGADNLKSNLIGDRNRIQQVFYNLIGNAYRHSNVNQPVEIRVIELKDKARIEVRDYGEGIAAEDLLHVFERYYKGKRIDGKKNEGTGLGLAIVKSIFDLHQSEYGVKSKLGEGTTFWFDLKKDNSHTSF